MPTEAVTPQNPDAENDFVAAHRLPDERLDLIERLSDVIREAISGFTSHETTMTYEVSLAATDAISRILAHKPSHAEAKAQVEYVRAALAKALSNAGVPTPPSVPTVTPTIPKPVPADTTGYA